MSTWSGINYIRDQLGVVYVSLGVEIVHKIIVRVWTVPDDQPDDVLGGASGYARPKAMTAVLLQRLSSLVVVRDELCGEAGDHRQEDTGEQPPDQRHHQRLFIYLHEMNKNT